jgi:Protein of unknown function (DUF2971)
MKKFDKIQIGRVNYSVIEDSSQDTVKFFVDNPKRKKIPNILYKYYPLDKNSVDACTNKYFFSSHPFLLNDKYDCYEGLINYSNVDSNFYLNNLITKTRFPRNKIVQLYNSDQRIILERTISELSQIRLFTKFGLISLTENYSDPKMWAYYSQNKGFTIKIKTNLLPDSFLGPFPITYSKKFERIDFTQYCTSLCILYQTNVKDSIWKAEKEWRFTTYNSDGNYHPFYSIQDIKSRYSYYDASAIKEVILGYSFIDPSEIEYEKRTQEYDIINFDLQTDKVIRKLKSKLLSYITDNNIKCSQIIKFRSRFKLGKKVIRIQKLKPNVFKIFNPFKFIID